MIEKGPIRLELSGIKQRNIDGQLMYFLNSDQWEKVKLDRLLDGSILPPLLMEYVESMRPYLTRYDELSIGIGKFGRVAQWAPYVILHIDSEFQRVHLERVTCDTCNSQIMIANPMVFDVYLGVPDDMDKFFFMRKANAFSEKTCPNCLGKLPRHAIWIVPLLE